MIADGSTAPPPVATAAALGVLLDAAPTITPASLAEAVSAACAVVGWWGAVHVVDHHHGTLQALPRGGPGEGPGEGAGRPHERARAWHAVRTLEPVGGEVPGDPVWVPLCRGAEVIGVLEVGSQHPEAPGPAALDPALARLASLVGLLLAAAALTGDTLHRLRGARRRSVRAELTWRLLPPSRFADDRVRIAGEVAPPDDIAGDVFDWAVDDGVARFGVLDAAGHDLRSGIMSTLAVAAYRKARHSQYDLTRTLATVEEVLAARAPRDGFVSAVFAELDLASGVLRYANAGQLDPVLVAPDGSVRTLSDGRRPALGLTALGLDAPDAEGSATLRPDEWLLLLTDGITEARDDVGAFFGVDRAVERVARAQREGASPGDAARWLVDDVAAHQRDGFADDATVMVVQWRGPSS